MELETVPSRSLTSMGSMESKGRLKDFANAVSTKQWLEPESMMTENEVSELETRGDVSRM